VTAKSQKDQKEQDAKITTTEEELRSITGTPQTNTKKASVIN